ncbi:MAG TPA: substrate-binding domain-containing protein [Acidimicrobiia bacterium]|nr:substrate-binding domain-containing protein [Acidimicrobiia bacterium]
MKHTTRARRSRSLLALLLTLGLLAGCAQTADDPGGDTTTTSGDTTTTSEETTATTGDPGAGGGYPSEDFWAGFEEIPQDLSSSEPVDTSEFEKPADQRLRIAFADSSQSNSLRVMARGSVEYGISLVDGAGAELIYTNANDSAPEQIGNIDDMLTQQVDALIVSAVDVNAICPAIDQALAAGVPVIVMERAVECVNFTAFVSQDVINIAENQAAYVAYRLGGEGKIAIISGIPGVGHSVESEQGYQNILDQYPDIEVVATEYAMYDPATARQVAESLLVAHPDLDAFLSASALMSDGIFQAAEAAGKVDQLLAWTGDDNNAWMRLAVNNDLPNMSVPYPVEVGQKSVEVAVAILRGEPVDRVTYTERPEGPVAFSRNLANYINPDRPDEWFYTTMPCEFDPFCEE